VSSDPGQTSQLIRFGEELELDRSAYQLRRSGRPVKLERIPLEILMLLTERPGQLVTREQIAERIWGKGAFLDVDNSINGAIRKIRQVLEDDPEQPRFIQTVTGRGYRFVAPVLDAAPAAAPPSRARPRSRTRLVLAAALLFLLAGAIVWSRWETPGAPRGRVMLAVLPFQNLTGDEGQEYLSDGLTEEMIAQLGNRDPTGLGVIARTSVMQYKRSQEPPQRIGRALGVQYLLSGSVRRDSSTIRVTAQLVRARDQALLWSQQYDRRLSGLLTLEGEIAREISDAIESSLGSRPRASGGEAPAPPRDVEAYDLFLRGQYFLNKRTDTDIEAAVTYFEQVTQRDPGFARGWAALASAEVLHAVYSIQPPQELVSRARAAALKALELDPSLAEAHTALALIVQNHDWDWQTAEREFQQAIRLNPSYATAHQWYAEHLMWRGRFDDALRESELARQLDPLSLIIAADNGAILYFSRQYDRAIDKLRSVNAINPNLSRAHLLVATYANAGRFDQALADEERWRPLVQVPVHWATLAYIYGRAGRMADAQRAIRELLQVSRREPVQARVFIWAYAGVEDTAETLAWLEKASAERSGEMVTLKVNPIYDFLHGDSRFQHLLLRVGLGN
jgi:TolB-like protein/DNA-binding winged helix-turn-helix (wHTH) protein/Flp pilus assembly protein TadD